MSTMSSPCIRHAGAADAPVIAALLAQLGYPFPACDVADHLEQHIDCGRDAAFVVEFEGRVCGLIALSITYPLHMKGGCCVINELVVEEDGRSKGLGSALLAHAEIHALEHGCIRMQLTSNESRTRAHAFYERQGYRERRKRLIKELVASA